jgi:hypothetical protein
MTHWLSKTCENVPDRAIWPGYFVLLQLLGFALLWDARLFSWYTDDYDYLNQVQQLYKSIWYLFSSDHISSGRPTTSLIFLLFHAIWGEKQIPYHLGLIFLHITTVWVVAWTLRQVGYKTPLAMLTGVILLFNVSRYEVPYWLSCVSYLGCMTLGCLSIASFSQFIKVQDRRQLVLACALILIAASFHAGAIGFAFLASYFAYRQGTHWKKVASSGWVLVLVCLALSTVFYLIYPENAQNKNVTHISDITHSAQLFAAYFSRTFLSPHWLPDAFIEGPSLFDTLLGGVLLALTVFLVLRRPCTPLDALVWAALTIAVFSGSTSEEFRSRYFYYAAVGPSLVIGWSIIQLEDHLGRIHARVGTLVPLGALVCLLMVSYAELQKTKSVFTAVIGRSYLAGVGSDPATGLGLMYKGILEAPDDLGPLYYVRYGVNAWYVGVDPTSVLEIGHQVYPNDEEISFLLEISGSIVAREAVPNALIERVKASRVPTTGISVAGALNNAGTYFSNKGDYKQAEILFASAIVILPRYGNAIVHYANCLLKQERPADALVAFERVFQIGAYNRYAEARDGLRLVLEALPDNRQALTMLLEAYTVSGNLASAVIYCEDWLAKHPDDQEIAEKHARIANASARRKRDE